METSYQLAARVIRQKQTEIAEAVVIRQYEIQPAVWKPFGDPGRAKSVRDAGYHLTYLAQALAAHEPALFTTYLAWVKVLFSRLKFKEDVLPVTLQITRQVLEEMLAPELAQAALEYLDLGLSFAVDAPLTLESFIETDRPLAGLARQYIDALLRGDRQSASKLILESAAQGTAVKDIYLYVFQSSQREIGRLWQTNLISVAQEHFCTAATQLIMSQLYPYIFTTEKRGRRLVAACVGGELHEIGARMVADFFEMDGWDTYFLGANTPLEGVLETIAERKPAVLAISTTMTFHVDKVAELIREFRRRGLGEHTKVMVGGYPFNAVAGLWQTVGADGFASDAQQALEEAERLLR